MTPSLTQYIEEKLGGLERFIERYDHEGLVELWVEVARTTQHHHKGDVFRAEADLRLPGKVLRAEEESSDVRTAVDAVKDKLHLEIKKYKTRFDQPRRRGE